MDGKRMVGGRLFSVPMCMTEITMLNAAPVLETSHIGEALSIGRPLRCGREAAGLAFQGNRSGWLLAASSPMLSDANRQTCPLDALETVNP